MHIRHSHIHITGLTFDGLGPDDPSKLQSYYGGIVCLHESPDYLRNLVIKPHGLGNLNGAGIALYRVKNAEVGEFKMIGPMGVDYVKFDDPKPGGEVVYVGVSNHQSRHIDDHRGYPTQKTAYKRTLAETGRIGDKKAVQELGDRIIDHIKSNQSRPKNRKVRKWGNLICTERGYHVPVHSNLAV